MDAITHPAPTLRYYLLDVFTENPFTGNPLAVFVDPEPLSDGQMQRIAAELGLSETVFVWSPPRIGEPWRTRIFTPAVELPFAGHPTVGAAFLLASLGLATTRTTRSRSSLQRPSAPCPSPWRSTSRGSRSEPTSSYRALPKRSLPLIRLNSPLS